MAATYIYKPNTYKGPVLLVPDDQPKTPPTITLPNGQVVTGKYLNTNEGRHQFVLPDNMIGMQGIQVSYNGQTSTIGNGAMSYEGSGLGNWAERFKGSMGDPSASGSMGGMGMGGMGGFGLPGFGGFSINFTPVTPNPTTYKPIKAAPYEFVDPIAAAERYATFNKRQEADAFNTGVERSKTLNALDTQAIGDFATNMSGLSQTLIAGENAFNQAQRLQAVDFALPDLRSSLDRKKERAETYASGRLLTSAEDRAYQVAAQSASADGSFVRGFGDDSVFGRRTSDILSAEQRLGISQMGEGMLNDWVSQASSLLIDTPLKSAISQGLPSTPPILPSQQAAAQQGNLANLTTIDNQFGISSEINQKQFGTNLEQGTRTFNASNKLQNEQFNSSQDLGAQQFNSSGSMSAQTASLNGNLAISDRVTASQNRAQDIARQDDQAKAAAAAADANISAQHTAANTGAIGQIGGAIVGAGITALTGMPMGGGGGGGAGIPGLDVATSGITDIAGQAFGFGRSAVGSPQSPITGGQSLQTIVGSAPIPQVQSAPIQEVAASSGGSVGGGQAAPQTMSLRTASGAPAEYNGSAIPVSNGSYDSFASAPQVAQGLQATGSFVSNLGRSGPSTPQMTALGNGISNGATAAQNITTQFAAASTPEAQRQLAGQLHTAALTNTNNPDQQETVNQIFSQVREHLDTGVEVSGQPAGIAGFIKNYDKYSGPEKVRGVTNISFAGQDLESSYGVKDLSAESLAKVPVAGTRNKMNLQDAISLANSGYNVSSLVSNWDEVEGIHSTINGKGNVLSVASTARNLGLLGGDTPEVVEQKQLALRQIGANPAGAWGAGAITVPVVNAEAANKQGYVRTGQTNDGQAVMVPQDSIASTGKTSGVVGAGSIGNVDGTSTLAIGEGASELYNSWGQNYIPKSSQSMGGSPAVANGLYKLGATNPALLGQVLFGAVEKGAANVNPTGAKELARSAGLISDEDTDDDHVWRKAPETDIGTVANISGQSLALLASGNGDDPHVAGVGHFIANRSTADIKDGALSQSNFDITQKNLQGAFSRIGVKNKNDGYALTNQAAHEGRFSQTQQVLIQQGLNLAFDQSAFLGATQLYEGARLGKETSTSTPAKDVTLSISRNPKTLQQEISA